MNTNIVIVNGRKFVPLKDYKKPLLKLGQNIKSNIFALEKQKYSYERKLSQYEEEYLLQGLTPAQKLDLRVKIDSMIKNINEIVDFIREIKISAYTEQLKHIDTTI